MLNRTIPASVVAVAALNFASPTEAATQVALRACPDYTNHGPRYDADISDFFVTKTSCRKGRSVIKSYYRALAAQPNFTIKGWKCKYVGGEGEESGNRTKCSKSGATVKWTGINQT